MQKCKHCSRLYDKPSYAKRVRKNYGYCSLECIENSKPPCPNCGKRVTRNPNEPISYLVKRTFCSQRCGASLYGSRPKSEQMKQRLSKSKIDFYQTDAGKQLASESGKQFSEWLKTQDGIEHRKRLEASSAEFRKTEAGKAMFRKLAEVKRTPEYRKKISETLSHVFNETDRGKELKEYYRKLYSGIPRSEEVTRKMSESLRAFYKTPEGLALLERMSEERTLGLSESDFGPNWIRQRRKAVKRDNFTCQICHTIDFSPDSQPSVHHIYARRLFRYVFGENDNFRLMNHLDNLISLCRSCHVRAEFGVIEIPEHFRIHADILYQRFTEITQRS